MAGSDPFSPLNPPTPLTAARTDQLSSGRAETPEARRAQMRQLAQEFEAMLMNEMLAGWRNSLLEDEADGEEGAGPFGQLTDMVGSEFGRALSRSGGLGIADVLMRSFERQLGAEGSAPAAAEPISGTARVDPGPLTMHVAGDVTRRAPGGSSRPADVAAGLSAVAAVAPAPGSVLEAATPLDAPVTSAYGWRSDPFTGRSKFHAGVDIRMAYGQEVASMAPGRVSQVGEQGGYGLTVVVDHGQGLQTRYAHLSSTDVQVGDDVSSGQRIARSGSSGRSTGPHLHVELLRDGRPVDPSRWLKRPATVADWMAERTPPSRSTD